MSRNMGLPGNVHEEPTGDADGIVGGGPVILQQV
jgi:hypothetical protein